MYDFPVVVHDVCKTFAWFCICCMSFLWFVHVCVYDVPVVFCMFLYDCLLFVCMLCVMTFAVVLHDCLYGCLMVVHALCMTFFRFAYFVRDFPEVFA